ncbi:hypothetical protein CIK05_15510 [Bdellovibrio sp. qaytius]|nr:hypothetical protein CIK05_15510 [Bdellovibrio sp. qaytius]
MRLTKRTLKIASILTLSFLFLPLAFTNCGAQPFQTLELSSLVPGDAPTSLSHPSSDKAQISTQKPVIGNRLYAASVIRDVFTNQAGAVLPGLDAELNKWVLSRLPQFGGGCDLYSSASGRDCGGDGSGVNVAPRVDTTTVRQTYTIKICENATSLNNSMSYVMSRLGIAAGTEPSNATVSQLYMLYYRTDYPDTNILNMLVQLNNDLKANGENVEERWRALTNFICELSDWQNI